MSWDSLEQATNRVNTLEDPWNGIPKFTISKNGLNVTMDYPLSNLFYKYLPYLISKSKIYNMIPRWNMRPDYCSYDVYGTTNLYYIIMYVNGAKSVLDFTTSSYKRIYVPPRDIVLNLLVMYNTGTKELV